MGLLDSLLSQGGYGGLLDSLMYQSPLTEKKPLITPSFGPNGEFDFYNAYKTDPFGAVPQIKPPSKFDVGTAPSPFTQFGSNPQPQAPVPQLPPAQTIAPAPQPAALPPQNYAPPQAAADTEFSSQQRQQQQPLPPNAGGPQGGGNNLMAGFQSWANTEPGNIFGGIANAIQGFSTGQRTDPAGMRQQDREAQFRALAPVLGPQNAMLAIVNPEAGKVLIQEALSAKQKFGVIGEDNGVKQYGFTNDREQTVTPYTAKGSETPGFVTGPDGKPIPIPPGVDRKTFVNEISRANAKAAAGEKTEVQANSESFANRMETAEKIIKPLEAQGTSLMGKTAGGVPVVGNYAQSPKYRQYSQAKSAFITALLRRESGAAIGPAEFERYDKEFFPQPSDDKGTIAQKAEARRVAIDAMKKGAGPGYKSPSAAPLPTGWSVQVR